MSGATAVNPAYLLSQLQDILDFDPHIDELGFIHPSQFAALNQEVHNSLSVSSGSKYQLGNETSESKHVEANSSDAFFWHSEHKLGISTIVLVPLYRAAKDTFMDTFKRYNILRGAHVHKDEVLDDNLSMRSTSFLDIMESELMKHSRVLLLLSCDFGTAWNCRKLVVSKKQLLPMFMDELRLSNLVLSYSPKSERAWTHRRWVIKMIAEKSPDLQELVRRESELVKTIVENYKMNYRAWNHRCWLVSYMVDSQVLHELQNSRDWAGLHVADNSCFHYRARLLLRMESKLHYNHAQDALSLTEFHEIWKEELDWIGLLMRRYVGRETLWLHRRFLSLLWMKHLAIDDQSSTSCHSCSRSFEICDISTFVANEFELFRSCTTLPDYDFGDHQAQAMYAATYIMWLAKQMPLSFGVELKRNLQRGAFKALLDEVGKSCLWDSLTEENMQ